MIHIFDVDYTLVNTSTVKDFILEGMRLRVIPLRLGFHIPPLFFRYTLKKDSFSKAAEIPCLAGIPRKQLEDTAAEVFRKHIEKKLDAGMCGLIRKLRDLGERIVLASSSFETVLEPLAKHLSIDEIISSKLEFLDGFATGRLSGIPAFGEGKRIRVLNFLEQEKAAAKECVFYTDSARDLPLLRSVGKPVAVNPGRRLRGIARREGWEIIN